MDGFLARSYGHLLPFARTKCDCCNCKSLLDGCDRCHVHHRSLFPVQPDLDYPTPVGGLVALGLAVGEAGSHYGRQGLPQVWPQEEEWPGAAV